MIKAELKNFTSDKFYMLIRAGSVALRMCFPVLVLILGSEEDLGRYYLINAAIVLVLFTLTFESGVFFASPFA